jgi:hypothetical protein
MVSDGISSQVNRISLGTTFKYVEGGPDPEAPEVI